MPKPKSIDDYLARVEGPRRAALVKLRKTVRALLPGAVECISYSIPAFRYDGHVVAGFLATSRGCSYVPFSGTTLATLAADLEGFSQTKSSLHFDPKHPLTTALVKKLLKARIAELEPRAVKARKAAKARKKAQRRLATRRHSSNERLGS